MHGLDIQINAWLLVGTQLEHVLKPVLVYLDSSFLIPPCRCDGPATGDRLPGPSSLATLSRTTCWNCNRCYILHFTVCVTDVANSFWNIMFIRQLAYGSLCCSLHLVASLLKHCSTSIRVYSTWIICWQNCAVWLCLWHLGGLLMASIEMTIIPRKKTALLFIIYYTSRVVCMCTCWFRLLAWRTKIFF